MGEEESEYNVNNVKDGYKIVYSALNSSLNGVLILDDQGLVIYFNDAMISLLGLENRTELMGKTLGEVFTPDVTKILEELLDTNIRKELKIKSCDGSLIPVIAFHTSMKSDSEVIGCMISMVDVSEKRELERRLDIEKDMNLIGKFAGEIAHDLKNILGVMRGHVNLLKLKMSPSSQGYESIKQLEQSSEKAMSFLEDLMFLSRDKGVLLAEVDLNQIVRDFLMSPMFQNLIKKNIKIDIDLANGGLKVRGNSNLLFRVIMNMIKNSIDAMGDSGKIAIRTEKYILKDEKLDISKGSYAVLKIADNGPGMPPEVASNIFEPFYSTKSKKGTGLGLSIVYNVVKNHRGFIDVHSKEGEGTEMAIYIPLKE